MKVYKLEKREFPILVYDNFIFPSKEEAIKFYHKCLDQNPKSDCRLFEYNIPDDELKWAMIRSFLQANSYFSFLDKKIVPLKPLGFEPELELEPEPEPESELEPEPESELESEPEPVLITLPVSVLESVTVSEPEPEPELEPEPEPVVEEQWSVYLLECSDKTIYTGITIDVEKRVNKHNSGTGAKYTAARRPVKLLRSILCGSHSDALKIEAKVKKLNRKAKLALINSGDLKDAI